MDGDLGLIVLGVALVGCVVAGWAYHLATVRLILRAQLAKRADELDTPAERAAKQEVEPRKIDPESMGAFLKL